MAKSGAGNRSYETLTSTCDERSGSQTRWDGCAEDGTPLWTIEIEPRAARLWLDLISNVVATDDQFAMVDTLAHAVEALPRPYDMVVIYGPDVARFSENEFKAAAALLTAHVADGLGRLVRVLAPDRAPDFEDLMRSTADLRIAAQTVLSKAEAAAFLDRTPGPQGAATEPANASPDAGL